MANLAAAVPPVAVVIPCYNHGAFLPEALAGVRAQTYSCVTCIVVDDGSTDPATRRLLDDLRRAGTQVVSQPNQGLAAARNNGLRATNAPFFVPLDADDRLHPRFIDRLLPPLLARPELGYCYAYTRLFGTRTDVWQCPAYDPRRLILYNLSPATAVIRRSAFDAVGGYQLDMTYGYEDWDFWLALLSAGFHGQLVPDELFYYRQHAPGQSMLARMQDRRDDMLRRMIRHHHGLYRTLLGLTTDEEDCIHQELAAAVELDHIERSHFWRLLHPLSRPGQPQPSVSPRQRLLRVKSSAAYGLIQLIKRTPLHRWYAARRYGPQE